MTIRHRGGCTSTATFRQTGLLGDVLERCTGCRAFHVVTDDPEAPEAVDADAPGTAYRCREHDTPVTWRGTGCQPCAHERSGNRRQRKARRRKQAEAGL
ncbi:hypothetical protein NF556_11570 [Ornithinimicrobium faecis]|uniref:Uncharacterized protein n=1 Tax=Ornithinimicrobium faecis TaxID=2934158 RepID=A0ABY4YNB9_9MICO|nr:hypothetical protein [Ornithinimicrobium sp. HY1793]USQ78292.1 hypothetical protein NF556_11570 [Ornithinimicrobium sp. HY1793]